MKKYKVRSHSRRGDNEEYPCDLCGSVDAVLLPYVKQYTGGQYIHICKKCGFVYVKMRRPYHTVADEWSHKLFGKAYSAKSPLMLARHYYIAEFIDHNVGLRNKRLCDIGAGEGQFLNIVKKNYGAIPFGVEPSQRFCAHLRKRAIDCFAGTLEEFIDVGNSKKTKFDIATLMWTLENATSPISLLRGAWDILKNKGYLAVATGSRILVPSAKPLNLYLSKNPVDTHPSRFSVNTLVSMLGITGFSIAKINNYLNDSLALCVIAQKKGRRSKAKIKTDDYRKVKAFFKKWHKETLFYLKYHAAYQDAAY